VRRTSLLLVFGVTLATTGCASIVSKSQYPVSITSSPPGAVAVIKDHRGVEIHKGITPTLVALRAGKGYFSKARYTLTCEKAGHYPSSVQVSAGLDGWYFANILVGVGGLIGMVIVDPLTGAMWKLDDTVHVNLTADGGAGGQPGESGKDEKAKGTVVVTSTPENADVILDGYFVGNAPCTLELTEAIYIIEVKQVGYTSYRRELKVFAGGKVVIQAILEE